MGQINPIQSPKWIKMVCLILNFLNITQHYQICRSVGTPRLADTKLFHPTHVPHRPALSARAAELAFKERVMKASTFRAVGKLSNCKPEVPEMLDK